MFLALSVYGCAGVCMCLFVLFVNAILLNRLRDHHDYYFYDNSNFRSAIWSNKLTKIAKVRSAQPQVGEFTHIV